MTVIGARGDVLDMCRTTESICKFTFFTTAAVVSEISSSIDTYGSALWTQPVTGEVGKARSFVKKGVRNDGTRLVEVVLRDRQIFCLDSTSINCLNAILTGMFGSKVLVIRSS